MNWLSNFAISKPVTTVIMIMTMFGIGLISVFGIPVELMPSLNIPVITVQVTYTGVSPSDMEELVAKPVEDAVAGVQGIDQLASYSSEGVVSTVLQFKWGADLDKKLTDVKEKMSKIRQRLPQGIDEPVISKIDVMGKEQVLQLNLAGKDLRETRKAAEDVVKPKIERIQGVGSVDIVGGLTKEILIKVDPYKLQAYDMTIANIIDILKSASLNMPAGKIKEGDKEFLVRTVGKIEKVEEIKNILLYNKNGTQIYMKDVVDIMISSEEVKNYNGMNGKESVSLVVMKESDGNTVGIADEIKNRLEEIKKLLPAGLELSVGNDTSLYIKDSVEMVRDAGFIGLILSAVIIFLFLKDVRATIIICVSIPVSVVFTFVLMKYMGLTMNLLSLGGLALGIGRLVDDSIIVLENIFRHISEYKKPPEEAARDGAAEMGLPILASASTTLAVFLPIIFTQGIAGEIFGDFALTVTFSLCASMFVSLTFVPMICSKVLKADKNLEHEGKLFKRVKTEYKRILEWALVKRKTTVFIALVLFIASLYGMQLAGMEFFPKTDRGQYTVVADLPKGIDFAKAQGIGMKMQEIVKKNKYTKKYITQISKNGISIFVDIGSKDSRDKKVDDVMDMLRKDMEKIPDAGIRFAAAQMGGGGGSGAIEVKLYGDDYVKLAALADTVKEKMKGINGVVDIKSSFEGGNPEVRIKVNRERAEYYGVSVAYVSSAVAARMTGTTAFNIQSAGEEVSVVVQMDESLRDSVDKLKNLDIPIPGKETTVPLYELADIKIGEGPSTIVRQDKSKVVSVTGNNLGRDLGSISTDITKELVKIEMPQGYSYKFGGDQKQMMETMGALAVAFLISLFLMYGVMAAQFESFIMPAIVMVTVPLGIIGVTLGLLVTGFAVSVTVFIGIIMLGGIVVNNAIVLIDYINILRARDIPRDEAVKMSGLTRIRPIFMTVATAVIGMVPLAVGIGAGADFYQPLAISVIFGLTLSTLLTLVVIPVLYSLVDDVMNRIKNRMKKKEKSKAAV